MDRAFAPFSFDHGMAVKLLGILAVPSTVRAQPDYGIDFVTVGAVNNSAFDGTAVPTSPARGHGSVAYEFRIGRTEITTAQWMEFENTFKGVPSDQAPPFSHWAGPFYWGAVDDPTYQGPGFRYVLPANNPSAGMQPVYGISWRECALYCNWLNNGKSSDPASLLTGAYDVSTWGNGVENGTFTDALTHLPDARFWIPTLDEQMKAFHYDPNRYGTGQGGYWLDMNMRDTPSIPGPPGIGQTSAGWADPVYPLELAIPLGAYPDQASPWGLLDTSGGATEWSELTGPRFGAPGGRGLHGSPAGRSDHLDSVYAFSTIWPGISGIQEGFRIASSIPSPSPCPADLDNDGNFANGGTRDRAVTIDDLLYFLAAFEAGNLAVDLDNGTGTGTHDGAVTVEDLLFFLGHFEAGC